MSISEDVLEFAGKFMSRPLQPGGIVAFYQDDDFGEDEIAIVIHIKKPAVVK